MQRPSWLLQPVSSHPSEPLSSSDVLDDDVGTSTPWDQRPENSITLPSYYVSRQVLSDADSSLLTATAMTLAAISVPRWITYSVHAGNQTFEKHIGLHQSCSNLDEPHCRSFPYKELCQEGERYFCSMWKTVGFIASVSALLSLAGLVAFAVVIRGGKYKRETGWPFATSMMALVSVLQFVTISIVVSSPGSRIYAYLAHGDCHRVSNTTTGIPLRQRRPIHSSGMEPRCIMDSRHSQRHPQSCCCHRSHGVGVSTPARGGIRFLGGSF